MGQHRRASAAEAVTQALVGLPIGFAVTYAIERLHLSPAVSAGTITGAMFGLSALRGYLIRRGFERRAANE
jgi:hypothetical protein